MDFFNIYFEIYLIGQVIIYFIILSVMSIAKLTPTCKTSLIVRATAAARLPKQCPTHFHFVPTVMSASLSVVIVIIGVIMIWLHAKCNTLSITINYKEKIHVTHNCRCNTCKSACFSVNSIAYWRDGFFNTPLDWESIYLGYNYEFNFIALRFCRRFADLIWSNSMFAFLCFNVNTLFVIYRTMKFN